MDRILIDRLKLRCYIGIHEWEKPILRNVYVSLDIGIIEGSFVDYSVVIRAVESLSYKQYGLLEDLSALIPDVLKSSGIEYHNMEVRLAKPYAMDTTTAKVSDIIHVAHYKL